jgi:hypothetical protein
MAMETMSLSPLTGGSPFSGPTKLEFLTASTVSDEKKRKEMPPEMQLESNEKKARSCVGIAAILARLGGRQRLSR